MFNIKLFNKVISFLFIISVLGFFASLYKSWSYISVNNLAYRYFYMHYITHILIWFSIFMSFKIRLLTLQILSIALILFKTYSLIIYYLFSNFTIDSNLHNEYFANFFLIINLQPIGLMLFGNNYVSFALFIIIYFRLIYIYTKSIKRLLNRAIV